MIAISFGMFVIGLLGVLCKRNALIFFLSIEIMLNGANLLFVTFARQWNEATGLIWVFFILLVAAAEAAIGLALMIHQFRMHGTADVDQYHRLRETVFDTGLL